MAVLVTGGAGYIGSHTIVELLNAGRLVVAIDNLQNSNKESLIRVKQITGKSFYSYKEDARDKKALREIFETHNIDSVIHFAGLKVLSESVEKPLEYYQNNIACTLALCEVMKEYDVKNLVFSSSAAVYGVPASVPVLEDFPLSTANPYGNTKLFIEYILRDLCASDDNWNVALLRYFNPVGAHKSGMIGEDPNGIPTNLMPYISQVAVGKLKELSVFGGDYPTADGTGVRDYIHVVDLAQGHVKALEKLEDNVGCVTYNLGTGNGCSVLEMIEAFSKVSGQKIPYQIKDRRTGDVASCYADVTKAETELEWKARRNLNEMCEDAWRWQSLNPNGYN